MTYTEIEASSDVEPDTSPVAAPPRTGALGKLLRLVIPLAIVGVGVGLFTYFSVEPEKAKTPPAEKQAIRTKVAELRVEDYQVTIKTNGIVQPHNEVGLSAEVSGQIQQVNPAFEVGSYFSAGDVLVELDPRDYKTAVAVAEAQKLGAEAAVQLASETFQRNQKLYDKNGISVAVYKQSFAAKAQAEAQLDTAIAQLERAERDLERTRIVAPFDGRVRMKNVGIGQSVGPGAPLGIVFAVDFAEVRLPISGRELKYLDLPELAEDEPVAVELRDAINKDSTTVWNAQIVRTEGTLDVNSLELFAIARIEDPFGKNSGHSPLRIGQPVVASVAGKTIENVVSVPRVAVKQLDQVYFVDKDSMTLLGKTLEPVWTDEENLIVRDPTIEDGQWLATTRIVYAPDGAKVEIIEDIPDVELTANSETSDAKSTSTAVAK